MNLQLLRLFEYDQWANREVLAALRKIASPPEAAVKRFAHIVSVEWLWYARIRITTSKIPVWPEMDLDESERQLYGVNEAWNDYLRNLTFDSLTQPVAYLNSKGEGWQNTIGDILFQVVFHSAGHRAQIASDLRRADEEPPYMDFIHAVRRNFIS
jgi:uncharacterized damage-inducible protein DinB